eukprot:1158988-Pelagomonas_calceolata.AAC.4
MSKGGNEGRASRVCWVPGEVTDMFSNAECLQWAGVRTCLHKLLAAAPPLLSRLSLGSDASSGERDGQQGGGSLKQRISLQTQNDLQQQPGSRATAPGAVAGVSQESNVLPEDRLKLAPILARRLEVVASASSFSSRVGLEQSMPPLLVH